MQHFDLSILDLFEASFLMLIRRISLDIVCFMCMGAGTLISLKMLTSVRVDDHIDMVILLIVVVVLCVSLGLCKMD